MSVSIKFDSVFELIQFLDLVNDGNASGDMNININGVPGVPQDDRADPDNTPDSFTPSATAGVTTDYASLRDGDRVRWEGRTIHADGTVVGDAVIDADEVTVVRIRRDDTGKVFKITFDDTPTFGTMYRL